MTATHNKYGQPLQKPVRRTHAPQTYRVWVTLECRHTRSYTLPAARVYEEAAHPKRLPCYDCPEDPTKMDDLARKQYDFRQRRQA